MLVWILGVSTNKVNTPKPAFPALLREHQSFSKPELLGLLKVAHDYTTSPRQHC